MTTFSIRRLLLALALPAACFAAMGQAAYDFSRLKMENLGRGVVAVRQSPDQVAVSWRYLSEDPENITFDVYRDGKKINPTPIKDATYFIDRNVSGKMAKYTVKPSKGKKEGTYSLPENAPTGYINIPLDIPAGGKDPNGVEYTYRANDCSIGDVDGDGEYEIFLKWDPTNSKDNSKNGYTGPTLIDCYTLTGQRLWRVDLGPNIRSGAHYTQFMVYDLDGDGKAEMVCKTADGTVDGKGKAIGDPKANHVNENGRILEGPEYLTVFNGMTGAAMASMDYVPARGKVTAWGDKYGNRVDRFLGAVAYLDGVHPSVVMCRGYYTRTVLAAFDWNGKELRQRWVFDTDKDGNAPFAKQGNHNLRVADVDGDGCDEIIYGQMAVDHDGTGLYSTRMGHGDAIHLLSDPKDGKHYVWACHENKRDGSTMRDARTGEVVFQHPSGRDIGRCMAADIDATTPGVEAWSANTPGIMSFTGDTIVTRQEFRSDCSKFLPMNFRILWTGDLCSELLDGTMISKYDGTERMLHKVADFDECDSNNASKKNPCLQADILGDWREEVLLRTKDNSALRIYITPFETEYRFHTFLEDPAYRVSVAAQNVGYNQPAEQGFYFGPELKGKFRGTNIK